MLKVGLTGGIGSGKSTVASLFAKLGVPVIDADIIAREVIADSIITKEIMQHFGSQVLHESGSLDRQILRKIVFEQPKERRWLEALLHPLIITEMQRQVDKLQSPYCLLVIPLLIEATLSYALVDRILVVDTSEGIQIKRTEARDHLTAEEVQRILDSQATRAQRLQQADDVIVNAGDLETLAAEVKQLHQHYLALSSGFSAGEDE
ncbi:MAG TPA: dephospho-CoA kinase [Patescibacteria group bacterium]|nr:dephospho-CoA kinase [Gammaproteobacteria bacterium]HWA51431.1 dephospho-CoA kinase [Patescibacteria group bacterium]